MDADILNAALKLRFGLGLSVNEQLQALYPHLSEEEADSYRREAGLVLAYGEEVAEKLYLKELSPDRTGDVLLLERFPWLQAENLSRVLSRGFHSAVHNCGYRPDWGKAIVWSLWFIVFVFFLFCLAWWL